MLVLAKVGLVGESWGCKRESLSKKASMGCECSGDSIEMVSSGALYSSLIAVLCSGSSLSSSGAGAGGFFFSGEAGRVGGGES